MADEGFDGFFHDMEELEEPSPFDLEVDDDGFLDEFDDTGGDDSGISRAFVLAAALITIAVVIVIILLLVFALSGDGGPSNREKTATAIVMANQNTATAYYATNEALDIINTATAEHILTVEASATNLAIFQMTQAALDAQATADAQTAVALTATAEYHASQTAEALVGATEAANATATSVRLTEVWEGHRLTVLVVDPDGDPIPNARVRLYRDNGNGEFDPEDREVEPEATPIPESPDTGPAATGEGETGPSVVEGGNQLAYGSVGEGTLGLGQTYGWVFEGSAGDEISISAEAVEASQMDTFLEVFDPNGTFIANDDDGGEGSNALIEALVLPVDGVYTIEVSSLAGEGDYVLRLFLTIVPETEGDTEGAAEEGTGEDTGDGEDTSVDEGETESGDADDADTEEFTPPTPETSSSYHRPSRTDGIVLVSGGWQDDPTPTPEGDDLQDVLQTTVQGIVDFGSLEPGVYWLELEYDSLPPVLQNLTTPDQPLFVQVIVPEEGPVGEITFEFQPGVTPTPIPTITNTPAPTTPPGPGTDILTPTPTEEEVGTITPPAEATLGGYGFFEDVSDSTGGIEGTSGLTVLVIAAAGLIAVVFIARKLRSST